MKTKGKWEGIERREEGKEKKRSGEIERVEEA